MTGMAIAAKRTQAASAAAQAHRIRVFIPMRILSSGAARGFILILSGKLREHRSRMFHNRRTLANMSRAEKERL